MNRYVTEYEAPDGRTYGYFVDALDFEHAQQQCDARRPGERVLGVLYTRVNADGFSHARADAMTKALAETDDGEPPDASEFPPIDAMGLEVPA